MAGVGEFVTGSKSKRQLALAEQAQARQQALIDEERQRNAAIAAGQRANAMTGGLGGLLAYADRASPAGSLKSTFGG